MAKSKYDLAKEIIATLTPEQLEGLKHHIEFFSKGKTNSVTMIPRTEDILLYESMKVVLSNKLRTTYKPLPLWLRSFPQTFRLLRKRATLIEEFIEINFKKKLTRSQKNKLYLIFCNVVANRIELTRVPLSLTSMLSFLNNLPGLVDKAFPGYIQSGMMDALIQFEE